MSLLPTTSKSRNQKQNSFLLLIIFNYNDDDPRTERIMCNVFDFYNQFKNRKDLVDLAFLVGGDSMWLIIQNKCHYLFILVVTVKYCS